MTTNEERLKILKMVEEGKISAEEAAKLLKALSTPRRKTGVGNARWLQVRVTDTTSGKVKALVKIPFSLVDAGLKIGAHFAPEIAGVDMSLVAEALKAGESGKIIDVVDEEDGEHVEIFVE